MVIREVTVIKPITGVAAAAVNVLGKQKDGKSNWKKLRAAHAEGEHHHLHVPPRKIYYVQLPQNRITA